MRNYTIKSISKKKIRFIGSRFQEYHFGHIVLNKFTFVITVVNFILLVSLKWDFDPTNYLFIIGLGCVVLIWIVGFILDRVGLRREFMNAQFKDVTVDTKDNQDISTFYTNWYH